MKLERVDNTHGVPSEHHHQENEPMHHHEHHKRKESGPYLIEAHELVLEYERTMEEGKLIALRDFSLNIRAGEFVTIVGPSGCGKSTFLNIVAGLNRPISGTIKVNGEPVRGPGNDRAMVFQEYGLLPWRTVQKNVEFGLEMRGKLDREARERVRHYIHLVGLDGFEHAYPRELSGGMRQRAGLARALAIEPRILLMDEPFAAVDLITREIMQGELSRIIAETSRTVIFVTHSVDEALILGDRLAIMTGRPGRIKTIISVDLPRPRSERGLRSSSEYISLREQIWQELSTEAMQAAKQDADR